MQHSAPSPLVLIRRAALYSAIGVALLAASACSSGDDGPETHDGEPSAPSGPCNAVTRSYAIASRDHVDECSAIQDNSSPPSGGDHYGVWAAFQTYDFPIPHGYLIHCMEHGAIVLYYNCPEGCADEVAMAEAFMAAQLPDPLCAGTGVDRRAVLVPDSTIPTKWAASAWGYTLRADCFDPQAFGEFYKAHYDQAPEVLCAPGVAFTSTPCQ